MLVPLSNKEISERWDVFKEMLRVCVPTTQAMVQDRMQQALFMALTGRIQCWFGYESGDDFYGAAITRIMSDPLTGEKTLLVYALQVFHQVRRETREADWKAFRQVARNMGCSYITAFTGSRNVALGMVKANKGKGEIVSYVRVPLED